MDISVMTVRASSYVNMYMNMHIHMHIIHVMVQRLRAAPLDDVWLVR